MDNSTVVLLKTHIWTSDIENFAIKILTETKSAGIDFFILMHTDDDIILNKIKNDNITRIILKFTETDIKNIYDIGFYSMWLSNHWILMWFYQKFGSKYKYFWTTEYDVRVIGDGTIIWQCPGTEDLLFPRGNYYSPTNKYINHYVGNKLIEKDKRQGFLQISRYSDRALTYLDECFRSGENGQDELIIFSLLNRAGFTLSCTFLAGLIKGTWSWDSKYAPRNKLLTENFSRMIKYQPRNTVYILHPVR